MLESGNKLIRLSLIGDSSSLINHWTGVDRDSTTLVTSKRKPSRKSGAKQLVFQISSGYRPNYFAPGSFFILFFVAQREVGKKAESSEREFPVFSRLFRSSMDSSWFFPIPWSLFSRIGKIPSDVCKFSRAETSPDTNGRCIHVTLLATCRDRNCPPLFSPTATYARRKRDSLHRARLSF